MTDICTDEQMYWRMDALTDGRTDRQSDGTICDFKEEEEEEQDEEFWESQKH